MVPVLSLKYQALSREFKQQVWGTNLEKFPLSEQKLLLFGPHGCKKMFNAVVFYPAMFAYKGHSSF